MSSPFEFVNSINGNKENLFETKGYDDSDYNSFVINRQFSYFPDTIFIANEINKSPHVPPKGQFDFYRFLVEPRKRFAKWGKPVKQENVDLIVKTYGVSVQKAMEVIDLFSESDFKEMADILSSGGRSR